MKSKKKKLISAFLVFLFVCLISFPAIATMNPKDALSDWGKKLSSYAATTQTRAFNNENLYAIGDNATVSNDEIAQATDFYIISGVNEYNAREQAIQYCMEREAMYQAAINAGYSVTDDEIYVYLEELKNIINESTNKEDAQQIINQFDSEEEYWNYQFVIYKKNLPIQKYVSALEKSFWNDSQSSDLNSASELEEELMQNPKNSNNKNSLNTENAWNTYFEAFKESKVTDENYQVLH